MCNKNKRRLVLESNSKNKSSSEEERKQRQMDWTSDLPDDVQKSTFTRLNWVDRIRLCGVSKNFLSLLNEIPSRPMERLPWLLTISHDKTNPSLMSSSSSTLIDPSSNRTYNVNKKLVVLPILPRYSVRGEVTLSMDPTSLECCFFYVWLEESMLILNISMCRIGDKNWSNLKFHLPADDQQDGHVLEDVICADGFLYCVLNGGNQLGILEVARQEWNFFTDCMQFPPQLLLQLALCFRMHVAFFNGDLFLLYPEWSPSGLSCMCLWRLDKFLKKWVRQESLGNFAFFFGWPSVLVEAVGELSPYANSMHSIKKMGLKFGSFSDKPGVGALYPVEGEDMQQHSLQCWIEPPPLIAPQ